MSRSKSAKKTITLSASRDIAFDRLVLSQSNVRHVKAGVSIEELAEDIARRTLQALVLIAAMLLLVYAAKSGLRGGSSPWITTGVALAGAGLLWNFVRQQFRAAVPMIDLQLLAKRPIAVGVAMALAAMIALVGFELLMAQELQFVYGKTPLEAGMFMMPLMIASGVSGPIAGWLVAILGLRLL